MDHYGSGELMVWADITLDGRTELHVLKRGTVSAVRQRDQVLEPQLVLPMNFCKVRILAGWIGQPDLNPMNHACDTLGMETAIRNLLREIEIATAGSDVVQSGRPIFDDFFQHLWPYIGNNTANVVFQMVKRLWLIRIDQ
ncbi:hypothetical protein TNCV_4675581 [Trichonephila clavipes]|nr:hypothetical protein TNCV_4675581 [Trichonephila clavipes]